MITADTYTSVPPAVPRRYADTTAKLVLAAARRTRDKIGERDVGTAPTPARRHVLPPGPAQRREEATGRADADRPVVTNGDDPQVAPSVHNGQTPNGRRSSKTAGQRPADLARPKGLEPPTF